MTAATSAGSRPFLCDCWRMTSSCLSGRVISCTACLSGFRPIRRTTPASDRSATRKRSRRRRTWAARRAAAVGRRREVALAVPILSQGRKDLRQLGLQLLNGPVVADDEVRFLRLFVLRELTRRAGREQLVPTRSRALG